jgi:plasmid stability protein
MASQTLTVQIPEPLYARLKQRAERSQRTIEAEMLDLLATTVPTTDELPPDFEETLAQLTLLKDDDLWQAARSHLAPEVAAELEALNRKRQREGLTEAETERAADLLQQFERSMLVGARAAALLKERGHDVIGLVATR